MTKINKFETFITPPRNLLIKIETTDGTVGWGEGIAMGNTGSVEQTIKELAEAYLVGSDPLRTEDIWQRLYRSQYYRGGPVLMSAISCIDQALWDIKGKHYGAPIYEFLGGRVRDRILLYADIAGEQPDELAEAATEATNAGYSALKVKLQGPVPYLGRASTIDRLRARFTALRDAVGDDVSIGVDFHGRTPLVKQMVAAIESFDPMFIEEPLPPEHNDQLAELATRSSVPIATGERVHTLDGFKRALETGAIDVIQPGIATVGGISEMMRIATLARAHGAMVSPQSPYGPIGFAASLHVGMAVRNVVIQQDTRVRRESDPSLELLLDNDPFDFKDGFIHVPEGPGLGIEPDEAYIREQSRNDMSWQMPSWHHTDGSFADW